MDTRIMSDEEWKALAPRGNISKNDEIRNLGARWASTVDWNNLPEDAANEIRKGFQNKAKEIVRSGTGMSGQQWLVERPADIMFQ